MQERQWKERGNDNSLEGDGSREIDHNEQSQGERSNHGCSAGDNFELWRELRNMRREKSRNGE